MNADFRDILMLMQQQGVRFLVVGAHALAVHGAARSTGDIDLWVEPTADNATRVMASLRAFGAPVQAHGLTHADLCTPGTVYQLGLPPRRIDVLTAIDGVAFDEAWPDRFVTEVAGLTLAFLGRRSLVRNKTASGRPKDLSDLTLLAEADEA